MNEAVDARARERARELLDRKDFAGALAAVGEAIALAPAEPYNHWLQGWIRMRTPGRTTADVEAAIASYRVALAARRTTGSWIADLGNALVEAGREEEAVAAVTAETTARDYEIAGAAHNWLGWYFSRKRVDVPVALAHLLEATRMRMHWGSALLNLAYVEDCLGQHARAFCHYTQAAARTSYDDAFATRRARELREEIERHAGERPAATGELTAAAREVMHGVAERLQATRFATWWVEIPPDALGDRAEELILAGFIAPSEGSATGFRVTSDAQTWILDHLGLVVGFCPKCGTGVELSKGSRSAQASCPVCGIGWIEDTTLVPFVPKY
jgi:tetratricopeptide (TPR) repeat protein